MKAEVNKVIQDYLQFNGWKTVADFEKILKRVSGLILISMTDKDDEAFAKLNFIRTQLEKGLRIANVYEKEYGGITVVIEETKESIEEYYQNSIKDNLGKLRPRKQDLGKLVDEGEVPTSKSRADNYWKGKVKVIFNPDNKSIRSGSEIPKSYYYDDIDFLEQHYNLRAIEFGNWLSQQDRKNYLAGLGLALFDLSAAIGISPKALSLKKKITVAFGARGRGSALAHFEADTFAINITRYSRPKKGSTLVRNFDRTKLLTASGGVGSFAHEYGHALDYFGGMYVDKRPSGAISDGRSLRVRPNKAVMTKKGLYGLMERLLYKIIWKNDNTHSDYYRRLESKKSRLTDYYFRRNELFARAFESYVHFKMGKKKYKNIFLAETKYDPATYLTPQEIKKLEPDFDALIRELKKSM